MATQVTMEDGSESPLEDHIRDAHQKGTRGFTEEYLDTMHQTLHQRKREPDEELEHRHTDAAGEANGADSHDQRSQGAMDSRQRDRDARSVPEAANSKHRDREQQEMSEAMKSKHRDRQQQQHTSGSADRKHQDRYAPGVPQQMNGKQRDMNGTDRDDQLQDMPSGMNGKQDERDEQLVSAGSQQRGGKHRKQRH